MPPESKQTPLPTIARCRPRASVSPCAAGAHDDHPRRVVASPPDRHEHAHAHLGRLLRADHVDPQPVLLGDRAASSASTSGETSLAARLREVARPVAPSPMIRPRSAAAREGRPVASAPGATRISSSRLRRRRARPPRGRSPADRTSPRRRRGRPARRPPRCRPRDVGERRQPERHSADLAPAQPALGGRGDMDHGLAIDRRRGTRGNRQDPPDRQLAGGRERRREALPRSSPNAASSGARRPTARSISPNGPPNAGSPTYGTTRTSAWTSQGWSATTRTCMT